MPPTPMIEASKIPLSKLLVIVTFRGINQESKSVNRSTKYESRSPEIWIGIAMRNTRPSLRSETVSKDLGVVISSRIAGFIFEHLSITCGHKS